MSTESASHIKPADTIIPHYNIATLDNSILQR